MIKLSITIFLLGFNALAHGQKIFDTLATESCECVGKLSKDSSGYVTLDSVTGCISQSVVGHFDYFRNNKKYSVTTVEGIQRITREVMDRLKKTCDVPLRK